MKYSIRIITPGNVLSTDTLFTIISRLRKDFEDGIASALRSELKVGKEKANSAIKGEISFIFEEVKRGSWEILLQGTMLGIIGKILYDVGKDVVMKNPRYEAFRDRLNGVSKKSAEEIKTLVEEEGKVGALSVTESQVEVQKTDDDNYLLAIVLRLERNKNNPSLTTDEEVEKALRQYIESKLQESNSKK